MANNDYAFQALLDLIKKNPQLINQVVFDQASIRALSTTEAAKKLAEGVDPPQFVDAPTFLQMMGSPADGYPAAMCQQQTTLVCGKGTGFAVLSCGGGTSGHNK